MKSKLAFTVLFSVFGIAAAAAAETAGVATSSVAYALPFSTFIIGMVLMTLSADYGRPLQALTVGERSEVMTPAAEAFGTHSAIGRSPAIRHRAVSRRRRPMVAQG